MAGLRRSDEVVRTGASEHLARCLCEVGSAPRKVDVSLVPFGLVARPAALVGMNESITFAPPSRLKWVRLVAAREASGGGTEGFPRSGVAGDLENLGFYF